MHPLIKAARIGAVTATYTSENMTLIPGEKFHHGLTVTDDLDQEISASFRATINRVRV